MRSDLHQMITLVCYGNAYLNPALASNINETELTLTHPTFQFAEWVHFINFYQQNGEVIGRLGGDQFLVVSLNNENADISSLRERIQQQIRGEYHLGDVDLYYPGASLGIVEVDPETTDADSALHAADIAMYQEKKHKQKTPFVAHPALHS